MKRLPLLVTTFLIALNLQLSEKAFAVNETDAMVDFYADNIPVFVNKMNNLSLNGSEYTVSVSLPAMGQPGGGPNNLPTASNGYTCIGLVPEGEDAVIYITLTGKNSKKIIFTTSLKNIMLKGNLPLSTIDGYVTYSINVSGASSDLTISTKSVQNNNPITIKTKTFQIQSIENLTATTHYTLYDY